MNTQMRLNKQMNKQIECMNEWMNQYMNKGSNGFIPQKVENWCLKMFGWWMAIDGWDDGRFDGIRDQGNNDWLMW